MASLLPSALPQPLPQPATAQQLEQLTADLRAAGLMPLRSSGELEQLSADAFVYSPVLQPLLQGLRAQLGVWAENMEQVMVVEKSPIHHLRKCSKHSDLILKKKLLLKT